MILVAFFWIMEDYLICLDTIYLPPIWVVLDAYEAYVRFESCVFNLNIELVLDIVSDLSFSIVLFEIYPFDGYGSRSIAIISLCTLFKCFGLGRLFLFLSPTLSLLSVGATLDLTLPNGWLLFLICSLGIFSGVSAYPGFGHSSSVSWAWVDELTFTNFGLSSFLLIERWLICF